MQLNQETVGLAIQALQFLWTVSLTVYVALSRSDADIKTKIEALEKDLNGYGYRLSGMDERIKQALTLEQLNRELDKLYEKIGAVKDDVSGMRQSIGELSEGTRKSTIQLDRLQDFLMSRHNSHV